MLSDRRLSVCLSCLSVTLVYCGLRRIEGRGRGCRFGLCEHYRKTVDELVADDKLFSNSLDNIQHVSNSFPGITQRQETHQ